MIPAFNGSKEWFVENGHLYKKGLFFIETLEKRNINSKGKERGVTGTLLITNQLNGDWRFAVCEECEIIIPEENLNTPINRKINNKYYCLNCIKKNNLTKDTTKITLLNWIK